MIVSYTCLLLAVTLMKEAVIFVTSLHCIARSIYMPFLACKSLKCHAQRLDDVSWNQQPSYCELKPLLGFEPTTFGLPALIFNHWATTTHGAPWWSQLLTYWVTAPCSNKQEFRLVEHSPNQSLTALSVWSSDCFKWTIRTYQMKGPLGGVVNLF